MRDRQIQLGLRDYAFGRAIPTLAVDEARSVTVKVLGNPLAKFTKLVISGMQKDGTRKYFDILAGEQPTCVPGPGEIIFALENIQVQNQGDAQGVVFMRIYSDTQSPSNPAYYLEATIPVNGVIKNMPFSIDMPSRDLVVTCEAGHL
jgi:hypothetical protein